MAAAILLAPAGALPSARAQHGVSLTFDGSFPDDIEQSGQLRVSTEGADSYFYMLLTNRGETGDTFDIYSEGAPGGWAAFLNITTVDLPAFQTQPIALVVSSPPDLSGGLQSWALVTVAARSRSDPTCTTHLHTLTVLDTTAGPALVGFAGPGQPAQFSLNVSNTGTAGDTITVDSAYVHSEPRLDIHQPWESHAPGSWLYSVTPVAFTLPGGGQGRAVLRLTAPDDSARGDFLVLNLTARSGSDPAKTHRVTAIIIVSVRYGVQLDCAVPVKKAIGGEAARFLINVTNTGTMRDVVSLSTAQPPYGWTASLGAASLVLNSAETRQVELAVTPPLTAPPNSTGIVRVTGRSGGNQSRTGWVDTFTVANPDYLLKFNDTISIRRVDPGNTTTHTLRIRNLGAEDDTAVLSLSGEPGDWLVSLGASSVPIRAGDSGLVTLDVTAPADALAGETLDMHVSCRSFNDPDAPEEVLARTTANRTRGLSAELSPAVLAAAPEEGAPFVLVVRNGGNAGEEVHFSAGRLPANWTMAFNESLLAVGARSSREVLCTVTPDFMATAQDHTVSAVALAEGLSAEGCATVSVRGAFRFLMECAENEKTALPGGHATFNVTIINRGNTDDTVLIRVQDDAPSSALDWSAGGPSVRLPVGGRGDVRVNLTVAPGAPGGLRGSCRVRGVSSGNASFWRELELGGTVGVVNGLGLTREPYSKAVQPGSAATFNLTVRNAGNVPENATLGLSGLPSGWSFAIEGAGGPPAGTFRLEAGGAVRFTLSVMTPPGASAGNYTLTVTLSTAGGMSFTTDCQVEVLRVFDLSLAAERSAVTVRAGGNVAVGLLARNPGNGPDEISVSVAGKGKESWAGLNGSRLSLRAGETGRSALLLRPPKDLRNGVHYFDVRARSSSGLERNVTIEVRVVQAEGTVTSEPPCLFAGLALAAVAAVAVLLLRQRKRHPAGPSP